VQSYCQWGVDYLKLGASDQKHSGACVHVLKTRAAGVYTDGCTGRSYKQINTSWIKFRAAIDECSKTRGFPMVLSVESCDDPTGCGTWIGKLANCEITVSAVKTALHPVYVACNVNITDTVSWRLPRSVAHMWRYSSDFCVRDE
jgi:hypothetical protein